MTPTPDPGAESPAATESELNTGTPAETLRAAADRIDQLAFGTTAAGPWEAHEYGDDNWAVVAGDRANVTGDGMDGWDATWIAAMSPAVAAPLAAWLRAEADNAEWFDPADLPVSHLTALAFARSLLRLPEGEPHA